MAHEARSDYWEAIGQSRDRYPHAHYLDRHSTNHWQKPRGRVSVLEFFPGRINVVDLPNVNELSKYLRRSSLSQCKHRLYLVEDLDRDTVNALGSHFWLDPYVFAAQMRASFWANYPTYVGQPRKLFSKQDPKACYTLKYLEINWLRSDNVGKTHTVDNFEREISFDSVDLRESFRDDTPIDKMDKVFYVRRNATFWARKFDQGWDGIILTEPPVKFRDVDTQYEHYQRGYTDFTPWPEKKPRAIAKGPSKQCMFDDLIYYWRHVATREQIHEALDDPTKCGNFLKCIVASQWNVTLEYLWMKLCKTQTELWGYEMKRGDRRDKLLIEKYRKTLSSSSQWRRRLSWFIDSVQWSLETLGISRDVTQLPYDASPEDKDYFSVLMRLQSIRAGFDGVTSDVTGIMSLMQSDLSAKDSAQSVEEARLSRTLAFVGLIFIPLAFSSSILSMGEKFQPGARYFWVFFALGLPLTVFTLVFGWLMSTKRGGMLLREYFVPMTADSPEAKGGSEKKRLSEGAGQV